MLAFRPMPLTGEERARLAERQANIDGLSSYAEVQRLFDEVPEALDW